LGCSGRSSLAAGVMSFMVFLLEAEADRVDLYGI